ncbi:hypothetical protein XdyCFBP7245_17715 [Xanthomonas dyei]|uniref:Uncharacterized protein n=1 Tax=Xanthomonas dyei TaxID=743699 RepID=A0A2S7BYW2_9XANT|nr:hypothetical protein XdyCFBP7245_17715 [Xanthomonas dyei]
MAASMPPQGPASGENTAPERVLLALLKAAHTDPLHRSLPAHRRGTFGGMDAAKELTWTYLQRVLRWWAGKGPAAKRRSTALQSRHAKRPASTHMVPLGIKVADRMSRAANVRNPCRPDRCTGMARSSPASPT